jgi:sensor histidine kinase YesM/streptogramin lyase
MTNPKLIYNKKTFINDSSFRILKIALITFIIHHLSFIISKAQRLPYTFENLKIAGNALDNLIICLLKDSRGYLWLGTANGLKRYDPTKTIEYRKNKNDKNSLIHNYIESIAEDKQGRIWIGTTEGICYLDRKTNKFTRFEELNKPDYACRNIICDFEGNVWFTIRDKGLFKFDVKTNQLSSFKHYLSDKTSLSLNRINVRGLIEDPNKKGIWISCMDKLNFYDFKTKKIYHSDYNPLKISILTNVQATAFTTENNHFVYSNNSALQMCWYDSRTNTKVKTFSPKGKHGHPFFYLQQIFFDSNHDIWLNTNDGRFGFVDSKNNNVIQIEHERGNRNSFAANLFLDVIQEKNGTLWFATVNGLSTVLGMAVLKPNDQLFNVYDFYHKMFESHPEDGFADFIEDSRDSTWWMFTHEQRLINYNPKTDKFKEWKIPKTPKMVNYDYVSFINQYHDNIFIFKPFYFSIFNKKAHFFQEFSLPNEISNRNSNITHTKVLGDSLWIFVKGDYYKSAYNYHFKRKKWSKYPIKFLENKLEKTEIPFAHIGPTYSLITKKKDFWIAIHSGGLAKFNYKTNQFEVIKTQQDIDFTKMGYTGFEEDRDGKIWVSSHDLFKFDPKTYSFESVLDKDLIGSMVMDYNDKVCMATFDEVMFFDEKKNEKTSFRFEVNDLIENWGNKLYKLSNSKIIAKNKQNIVLVNFKRFEVPSFIDQLYINQITTANSTIIINDNDAEINFRKDQNSIAISYGVLSLPKTSIYEFYYQLEGFDKDWQSDSTANKFINYGNLDGGEYIFKVKAKDLNGKFLPEQRLFIHIDTPFYKTLWFRSLLFLIFSGLVYAFVRFRANQRKKIHHLELQSSRLAQDKTEIQYQNLINHLNPHFLFNSLTSLNSLITINPRDASTFLEKLSLIYRYILQNKEKDLVSLKQELDFVQHYIDLQKTRFEDGLLINIDVSEVYFQNKIVPVTIQNLIENAIKHNIIDDELALKIDIFIENEYLIIKNNLQKKDFVETSNKQGLESLKSLYTYLANKPLEVIETEWEFMVRVPLL